MAFHCANATTSLWPTMSSVVSMPEDKTAVEKVVSNSSEVLHEKKLELISYQQIHVETKTRLLKLGECV